MIRIPRLIIAQSRRNLNGYLDHDVPRRLSRTRTSKAANPKPWSRHPVRRPGQQQLRQDAPSQNPLHKTTPKISADQVPDYFARNVSTWISQFNNKIMDRLTRFGVPNDALRPLIKTYAIEMEQGNVFRDLQHPSDQLERIASDLSLHSTQPLDRYFTKFLYEWASHPRGQNILESVLSLDVVSRMQALYHAADLTGVGWEYTMTRRAPPRKFIMHVGPTNSGKTHNALRALAAAKRGMYAGPLRLLAFEIFDRLNKGQIVPLGVDVGPDVEPDSQSSIDVGEGARKEEKGVALTKQGNPRFARPCNMVTGEEKKLVIPDAPLLSCTVEMTPLSTEWDVAVIDEIQLISDPQRGGSWTAAVLGLNAKEIHLCGEESAIPIIQALAALTGDKIEINRYNRLTPLVVAEKSLEGDLSRVRKGDCLVTFSRTGLFGLKHQVEQVAKVRCALAYGRLPPEMRSEQAALFNDPNNDYNVLVGSDAVGMGLNLKIKRVIFEASAKYDGKGLRPLSVSQIKQIAGRAGRFGMHDDDSVGVVTTLREEDLERVREAMAAPSDPLRYARLNMSIEHFTPIVRALPWDASNVTVYDVQYYVSKMPPLFESQEPDIGGISQGLTVIDAFKDCLVLANRLMVQNAPCPWRDESAGIATRVMMEIYREKLHVPIDEALYRAKILKHLNKALVLMEGGAAGKKINIKEAVDVLGALETVHKTIVVYLWFSYRFKVPFSDQARAFELRRLTELAMDWCLELMHQLRIKAAKPMAQALNAVSGRRPPLSSPEVSVEDSPVDKAVGLDERWVANIAR